VITWCRGLSRAVCTHHIIMYAWTFLCSTLTLSLYIPLLLPQTLFR